MHFELNKSLQEINTFHINECAEKYVAIHTVKEALDIFEYAHHHQLPLHILGGGSNVLLTKQVEGILVQNKLKGIEIIFENEEEVHVQFQSGEVWHECVLWAVEQNYGGIENLSLIPGTIGAAPIQNIGAYGIELKDVFHSLEAISLHDYHTHVFTNKDCAFGYRESVFKQKYKGQYFIQSVTLCLKKKASIHIQYGNIQEELQKLNKDNYTIQDVSNAIIAIRKSKLPNPEEIGNAGSFFKNPVVAKGVFENIQKQYENVPHFMVENGIKIPAAWLIEKNNWKGFTEGEIGVHKNQALVLVNYGNAKGNDIFLLSEKIINSVKETFDITLEREVNIW